jgi:hypothetical protein
MNKKYNTFAAILVVFSVISTESVVAEIATTPTKSNGCISESEARANAALKRAGEAYENAVKVPKKEDLFSSLEKCFDFNFNWGIGGFGMPKLDICNAIKTLTGSVFASKNFNFSAFGTNAGFGVSGGSTGTPYSLPGSGSFGSSSSSSSSYSGGIIKDITDTTKAYPPTPIETISSSSVTPPTLPSLTPDFTPPPDLSGTTIPSDESKTPRTTFWDLMK